MLTHPTMTPSQAKSAAIRCIQAGLVPFIQSSPGMGKSSIAREIAHQGNLQVIDVRLSQCAPEDLQGLPMRAGNKAQFIPFDTFPIVGDTLPPGKAGWLVFLDEFNSGSKSTQAAAYKLVLDREVGKHSLHPNVAIMAAGNLSTDRAIVNPLSTAMQSRLAHIHMTSSKSEWIQWANQNGIDYRVIGFIEFQPTKLNMFMPDHQDCTFACERTWEFASKLIQNESDVDSLLPLLSGVIGPGVALEFVTFCREYTKIPKISQILADPEHTIIPAEISTKFATMTSCMANADENNIKQMIKYIRRFATEEQVIFYRSVIQRNEKVRDVPEVAKELIAVMRFINA